MPGRCPMLGGKRADSETLSACLEPGSRSGFPGPPWSVRCLHVASNMPPTRLLLVIPSLLAASCAWQTGDGANECSASWAVETVDPSGRSGAVHVLLEAEGPTLLATAGAAIRRARRLSADTWKLDDHVPALAPSSTVGFALAPDGRPYAAYETGGAHLDPGEIVMGVRDDEGWELEPLGVEAHGPVAIGFDAVAEPHLFVSGRRLDRTAGGWRFVGSAERTLGVAFGRDGTVHALLGRLTESQFDDDAFQTGHLEYVATALDGTELTRIDLRRNVWEPNVMGGAIAIDPRGGVQICWFAAEPGETASLRVTSIDAEDSDQTEVAVDVDTLSCAIAVQPDGVAHVAFTAGEELSSTEPEARYATHASGAWEQETIRAASRVASMALGEGTVDVAWTEATQFNEPTGDVGWARRCIP